MGDLSTLESLGFDLALLDHATDDELALVYEALEQIVNDDDGEWTLQERQQIAEDLTRSGAVFELLYGGAAGGGKSDWLLYHFYNLCLDFPGFRGLLLRRSFPDLRRSLITRSWEKFDRKHARYVMADHTWYFHNGSVLEFGYCETDRDVYQYQSAEYGAVGFDEMTQWPTPFCFTYLASRVRVGIKLTMMGFHPHMVAGTNPGGEGGLWVKERWVDPAAPGEVFHDTIEIDGEEPRDIARVFVPAKLEDNRHVNRTAYRIALANLPRKIRQQLEDGSWDVVEGQYFDEWDRDLHVVRPFTIPDWWERVCGYDFGHAAPACHLWAAFDPDGRCYIYREAYGGGKTVEVQSTEILEAERADPSIQKPRETPRLRVADPSIWINTGSGPPIARQFGDHGVYFLKANNARIDGWMRVRSFLASPQEGPPMLQVFSTCHNLIRTLPMLIHDDKKPEDLNTRQEDHAADALRYLLMSRPPPTTAPSKPTKELNEHGERLVMPDLVLARKHREQRAHVLGFMR